MELIIKAIPAILKKKWPEIKWINNPNKMEMTNAGIAIFL